MRIFDLPFLAAANADAAAKMSTLDVVLFIVTVLGVIPFGMWKGRTKATDTKESGGKSGYFLAGRGLSWWVIGFSLIAANISTEQFVGMSGQASNWLGLAVSSWEWLATIALVLVAFVSLPKLLRCGIYTIPEFLEYRFDVFSRTVMAILSLLILVGGPTASVIYSGSKVVSVFFQGYHVAGFDLGSPSVGCWIIGLAAGLYVMVGGTKATSWTGLIWGAGLIAGGTLVALLAFGALKDADPHDLIVSKVANSSATVEDLQSAGPWERFMLLNAGKNHEASAADGPNLSGGKLHMIRPITDPELPWSAMVLGMWVPVCFYWGLNQFIVQRTLGSRSLAEGQKGVIFAAYLKLLIPFFIVIPGILCFNLYHKDLKAEGDKKNAPIFAELAAGSQKVYPLSPAYFQASPAQAAEIYTHNAQVTGQPATSLTGLSPEKASAANAALLTAATGKAETGNAPVGYDYDAAFPTLLRNLMRPGITWFVLAAIFGAVVSALASMLSSAATLASIDLYGKLKPNASEKSLVGAGRFFTVLFVLISILTATVLADRIGSVFSFIQEIQGFISPGVLAVFLFGFLSPRTPRYFGWLGIVVNALLYGAIKRWLGPALVHAHLWFAPEITYVDRMGLCFLAVLLLGALVTLLHPLANPVKMPVTDVIALDSSKGAKVMAVLAVILTIALYVIFW